MHKTIKIFAVQAVLAAAAVGAHAESCTDTQWSALSPVDCAGSFVGNINGSPSETAFLDATWGGSFSYLGKSDDAGNGPFSGDPHGITSGTLTFDTPLLGEFVIGLKASNNYSYFLFDALSPVSSLTFSSTAGVAVNRNGIAQGLSHAALYAVPAQPVPEPETYALMLAGFGAMGFIARRRKS